MRFDDPSDGIRCYYTFCIEPNSTLHIFGIFYHKRFENKLSLVKIGWLKRNQQNLSFNLYNSTFSAQYDKNYNRNFLSKSRFEKKIFLWNKKFCLWGISNARDQNWKQSSRLNKLVCMTNKAIRGLFISLLTYALYEGPRVQCKC